MEMIGLEARASFILARDEMRAAKSGQLGEQESSDSSTKTGGPDVEEASSGSSTHLETMSWNISDMHTAPVVEESSCFMTQHNPPFANGGCPLCINPASLQEDLADEQDSKLEGEAELECTRQEDVRSFESLEPHHPLPQSSASRWAFLARTLACNLWFAG
eukprot:3753383-Amphidinium_carterae.1